MNARLKPWLFSGLLLPVLAQAGEKVDIHYSNRQILDAAASSDATALGEAWFARCAAGGEFAQLARSYAPDPRITRAQREAAEKSFD